MTMILTQIGLMTYKRLLTNKKVKRSTRDSKHPLRTLHKRR